MNKPQPDHSETCHYGYYSIHAEVKLQLAAPKQNTHAETKHIYNEVDII